MPRKYNKNQLNFLETNFKKLHVPELTAKFNHQFSLVKTEQQIKATLTNHSFRCGRKRGFKKGTLIKYTQQQKQWLQKNYKILSRKQITDAFNSKFKTEKTVSQLSGFMKKNKIFSGRNGRYKKGNVPHPDAHPKGPNKTSFKKGHVPANFKPIGHERICSKDGITLIKVDAKNPHTKHRGWYRAKHIVNWESVHGQVPKDSVIRFKTSDRTNCDLDNLECIPKTLNLALNRLRYSDHHEEFKPTVRAVAELEIITHKKNKEASQ